MQSLEETISPLHLKIL